MINPGNVATEEVISDSKEGRFSQQVPIPITDVIETVEWISLRSDFVEVGEVNLLQK